MTRLLAALSAVTLALALQINNGAFDPVALALVVAASVLALLAAGSARRARAAPPAAEARFAHWTRLALGAGCVAGLACTLLARPALYLPERQLGPIRALALTALLALSAYLCAHLRPAFARARFALLLVLAFAMGAAVIQRSPRPWIDVWYVQQLGADALLSGRNPYAVDYPDLYSAAHLPFNDPSLVRGGTFHGVPYPPLSPLLAVPARVIFGDIRFLHLCALLGAALLLAQLGRAAGDPVAGELAGLFVALQPRALFVIEQSWIEPTVLFLVLLALSAGLRWWREAADPSPVRPPAAAWWAGIALGLALSIKQYTPLLLAPIFAALPRSGRLRAAFAALLVATAIALPFALWGWDDLFHGVIRMQLLQPVRADALSLVAIAARQGQVPRSVALLGFGAAFAVLAAFWPRAARMQAAAATASAAFLWLVVLNKQAFCNYYFLAVGLLCATCTLPTDAKSLASPAPPR